VPEVNLTDRRSFLILGSGAALGSTLPSSLFAQVASSDLFSNRNLGLYTQGLMTQATFERVVGSVFRATLDTGSYANLTLVGVKAATFSAPAKPVSSGIKMRSGLVVASAPVAASTPKAFTLNFTSGSRLVPQGSYELDHGTLGSFVLFLVPGDPVRGGTCSACFSLL
jgi:hypothetical protein